ncbi:hypothetical protein BT63DRAFT_420929 [Microthyrium microscopicum]|uniref:Uncharacterized protein n=1 Tax=Microthyrium microscopicum TaxID=703497 RepID=A0A6A6ULZ8_9PEZI|nr:hypothetical protein BT63DRAFT_420929 [Microthyrium microscopicum]
MPPVHGHGSTNHHAHRTPTSEIQSTSTMGPRSSWKREVGSTTSANNSGPSTEDGAIAAGTTDQGSVAPLVIVIFQFIFFVFFFFWCVFRFMYMALKHPSEEKKKSKPPDLEAQATITKRTEPDIPVRAGPSQHSITTVASNATRDPTGKHGFIQIGRDPSVVTNRKGHERRLDTVEERAYSKSSSVHLPLNRPDPQTSRWNFHHNRYTRDEPEQLTTLTSAVYQPRAVLPVRQLLPAATSSNSQGRFREEFEMTSFKSQDDAMSTNGTVSTRGKQRAHAFYMLTEGPAPDPQNVPKDWKKIIQERIWTS